MRGNSSGNGADHTRKGTLGHLIDETRTHWWRRP